MNFLSNIKTRKWILVAIATVVVLAAIILLAVYLAAPLAAPTPRVSEIGEFELKIEWDKTFNAMGYILSYRYAEFTDGWTNVETKDGFCLIPRYRGVLQLSALSFNGGRDSGFKKPHVEAVIPALTLGVPQAVGFEQHTDSDGADFVYIVYDRVKYKKTSGEEAFVGYYEIGYRAVENDTFYTLLLSASLMRDHKFYIPQGEIEVRVRPLNYIVAPDLPFGEIVQIEQRELFQRYEMPENYARLETKL